MMQLFVGDTKQFVYLTLYLNIPMKSNSKSLKRIYSTSLDIELWEYLVRNDESHEMPCGSVAILSMFNTE